MSIKEFVLTETALPANTKKTADIVDPEYSYNVVEQSGCDIVIEKKCTTRKTPVKYLAMIPSQNQFYIKTGNKIQHLTGDLKERHVASFLKDMKESIPLGDFWLDYISQDASRKINIFVDMNKRYPLINQLTKHGLFCAIFNDVIPNMPIPYIDDEMFIMVAKKAVEIAGKQITKNSVVSLIEGRSTRIESELADRISELLAMTFYLDFHVQRSAMRTIFERYGHGGIHTLVSAYLSVTDGRFEYSQAYYRKRLSGYMCDVLDRIPTASIKAISEYLAYSYIRQGYSDMHDYLAEWADILRLQIEYYGEVVEKYPAYLCSEHKRLGTKVARARCERDEEAIAKRSMALQSNTWSNTEYVITVPNSSKDMLTEAERQANCLGGYIGEFANGTCDIYFMRSVKEPDSSLIDIEVRNGVLRQAYRANNVMPNAHELDAIREWGRLKNIEVPESWVPRAA